MICVIYVVWEPIAISDKLLIIYLVTALTCYGHTYYFVSNLKNMLSVAYHGHALHVYT